MDIPNVGTSEDRAEKTEHQNIAVLLAGLLSKSGRKTFTLTLEDGRFLKLEESDTPSELPNLMTMQAIAKAIGRSYSWVSRNWKTTMRLTPRHIGATLFFKRSEVEGHILRNVVRRKPTGRPKKIVGVITHAAS